MRVYLLHRIFFCLILQALAWIVYLLLPLGIFPNSYRQSWDAYYLWNSRSHTVSNTWLPKRSTSLLCAACQTQRQGPQLSLKEAALGGGQQTPVQGAAKAGL